MKIVSIHTNMHSSPRLTYTIAALNEHPFVIARQLYFSQEAKGNIHLSYGDSELKDHIYIPKQQLIFEDVNGNYIANKYAFGNDDLYSVELVSSKPSNFYADQKIGFDIFETLFFHLSRYEERTIDFPAFLNDKLAFDNALLSVKCGIEKIPIVDDLIVAFLEIITDEKVKYSKSRSISHDIDYIQKFKSRFSIFRKVAGHIRHQKSMLGFSKLWESYLDFLLRGQDAFDTFDWMLSEQKLEKTIYFLVGGNHKEDNEYSLKSKVVQKAIRLAKERNYNIGIHPSYESWNDIDLIRSQKKKLENEVGFEIAHSRQHFLNFDISKTPELLQRVGIREDSSLGYTRHIGYRCGTGFPYKLYDFENEKAFDVVERPLVFMDVAWLYEALRINDLNLPDLSKFYGSFNFHNSTFDEMAVRNIDMKTHYLKTFE